MKKYFLYATGMLLLFAGCEEVLLEEDFSGAQVMLLAPTEGTVVNSTTVTFSWEAVDQATTYHLQVATPSFEDAVQIVKDTTLSGTRFSTQLLKNNYEWRVRAQNSGSQTPYVGASFQVVEAEDFSSRTVAIVAPADNTQTNQADVDVQWQALEDATLYRIQVLNSSDEVQEEFTTSETSLEVTFPEGNSRWQVRAENASQSTLYTTRSFTLDTMNPNIPSAEAPANEAVVTAATVEFRWARELVEGTAEFDSIYIYRNETLTELVTKDEATSPAEFTLEAGNTYYWRLQAFDQAGNQSEQSPIRRFTIN